MKKLFLLISFLIAGLNCFAEEATFTTVDTHDLYIKLNKPGISEYYFAEYQTNNQLTDNIQFSLIERPNQPSSAYFSFVWQIYYNGSVAIYMDFLSDSSGHMLQHTEDSSIALDYSVYKVVSSADGSATESSELVRSASIGAGTVKIMEESDISTTTGTVGRIDMKLDLEPPASGFMSGQYRGQIVVRIQSES